MIRWDMQETHTLACSCGRGASVVGCGQHWAGPGPGLVAAHARYDVSYMNYVYIYIYIYIYIYVYIQSYMTIICSTSSHITAYYSLLFHSILYYPTSSLQRRDASYLLLQEGTPACIPTHASLPCKSSYFSSVNKQNCIQ